MASYDVDIEDIRVTTACLYHLLRRVYEASTEISYVRSDGSRDDAADHLNHLIILARDEAERINESVDRLIEAETARRAATSGRAAP